MKVRLIDICQPKQWQTISTDKLLQSGYPVYGANGIIGYYDKYNHIEPTLMITCRGATCGAINISEPFSYINGNAMSLDNLSKNVLIKYLYYQLINYDFKRVISGSAQPQITQEGLSKVFIELHSTEEQKIISINLDKIELLIKKRNQQLEKLDLLIKSKFNDMFGDYNLGTNRYKTQKLGELSKKISDGVHAKPDYVPQGRPFISVQNINQGVIDFSDCKYVTEEAYQKMIKSTKPEFGDVLYTKVGTYGIPAYIDTNRKFCLYVSVCLIKPNNALINPHFLSISMGMQYVKKQADSRIKGIGVPDLHLNQIREFDIILPPLEVQNQFVLFVEQTDKTKAKMKQSLEKLETLKKSLMQKYFG